MLKKIGAITAVDALTKVLGYLLLPVYLGLMPKVEFGEFGFLTSALTYASLILGLYLYVPFIRNYCALNCESKKRELVSTILLGLLIWLLLINIPLIALKPLLIEIFSHFFEITTLVDEKYYLSIVLINTGIAMLYCYSLLMARKSTKEIVVFIVIKFAVATIINLSLLYINPWQQDSVLNRLIGTAIAELAVMLGYVFTIIRPYIKLSVNKILLKSNLRIAIPLIPSALISLFVAVIDRKIIAQHHGLAEVADYNLAMQALAPIQMLMSAVQVAWAPHVFSMVDASHLLRQSIRLMLITSIVMFASAIAISFAVNISISYGFISKIYINVPGLMLLLSIGVIIGSLTHVTGNLFIYFKKTNWMLLVSFVALVCNLVANVLLVPLFSTVGAATSLAISNAILLALSWFAINRMALNGDLNE